MVVHKSITELIGNTPLLEINPELHGLRNVRLIAKLEMQNIFGSLKDRIAWNILKDDLRTIREKHLEIVELSSGNTAKALAVLANMYGVTFKTVTNRIKVREQKDLLLLLGATIEELPGLSECPDLTNPNDPLTFIKRQLDEHPDKYYHTDQYFNPKNKLAHFRCTAQEILDDLGAAPDYFIAGLGTAGSSSGVTERLTERNPGLVTVGVVAEKSDFIPGIRTIDEMYEVGLFQPERYTNIEVVSSHQAVDGSLELVRRAGLLAGPTTGSTYRGALQYLRKVDAQLDGPRTAVFIACDRIETYVSYFKQRRPELFKVAASSVEALRPDEVNAHVREAEPAEFAGQLRPETLLIDARGAIAFQLGTVDRRAVNIPQDVLDGMFVRGLPFSKERPVAFVCPTGAATRKFTARVNEGGGSAINLKGGIAAWIHAGRPLVRV
jgi:cysteine synthase/rhodanese-related sulfurtransferase